MTDTEIKQDFEGALTRHLSFKARLRSFLYGNAGEQGPLRDPDQCSLGQWIAERRRGVYAHLPEMSRLDQEHRRIHAVANRLMDLHTANQPDQARADFDQVQRQADHIVALLRTLEAQARTEG